MAVYYEHARKRLLAKWYLMLEANTPANKKIKLYKKSPDGRISENEVSREQWVSEKGYEASVSSRNQRLLDTTDELQRLEAVRAQFPQNKALRKALQKRLISIVDLTPQEVAEIEDEEAQNLERGIVDNFTTGGSGTTPALPAASEDPATLPAATGR